MQFLALLFLMLGVVVIMFAAFLALSYGAGVYWYSREGAVIRNADPNPCAQCDADQDWFVSQPVWKRNVITAWWWANRLTWAGKGCK
jgi:hypothetical protein